MKRTPFRPATFIAAASLLCLLTSPLPALSAPPDFNDLTEVLRVFSDSRLTRDLKLYGDPRVQEAFINTLDRGVYQKADAAVIEHLRSDPALAGKRIITHDFRTPGAEGVSVNTDRDVRVLVEVEPGRQGKPGRWIEVPVQKWQDVYYREFAQRTGYRSDSAAPLEKMSPAARQAEAQKIRAHADRYRQLATDKFHMEASADYSDQRLKGGRKDSSIRVTQGPDGKLVVESLPQVVKVKAGEGILASAEGMAQMYRQKAWDQLGKAEEIALRLKDPALPQSERTRLEGLRKMHAAEGLVQMKKGFESLEAVRTSYQKQGYRVGEPPKNFQQAAEIVKAVTGGSRTDVDAVLRNLQEHGFRSATELSENMRGQMESLKLAGRKPPPPPPTRLQTAGRVAGWATNVMGIDQRLKEARQGRHIIEFLNLDKGDGTGLAFAKMAGIAAVELIPVPVIDAVQRGWRVQERAEAYLAAAVKRGEADWTTHPAFVMFAVTSTITTETIASLTVDPLIAGAQAVKEGALLVRDVGNNFLADFEHAESQRIQRLIKTAAAARAGKFGLGGLAARRGGPDGGPLVGEVKVGETIAFSALKNDQWTDAYSVRWNLTQPDRQQVTLEHGKSAAEADAERIQFAVAEGWPPGTHTLSLQIFERGSFLLVDRTEATFTVSGDIGIGAVTAATGHFIAQGGSPLLLPATPIKVGELLAFEVPRIGIWSGNHEVQWLVNGEGYKTAAGDSDAAHRLRFDSAGMAPGSYAVAVRLIDTAGKARKIVAHRQVSLRLVKSFPEMAPFAIRAALGDYDGPPLPPAVQNGEALALQADLAHPPGEAEPAELFWQVFDQAGNPVPGLGKREPLLEGGTTKNHRFRFQLEDLADGGYIVALTHVFSADPERRTQSTLPFRVSQSVRIEKVLATDNPDDQTHKPSFSSDQEPLLYAHYALGPGITSATVTLTASEAGGRVIETVSLERPRSGETPPYRAGLAIPSAKIPVGVEVTVEALIVGNDGKRHAARTTFKKEAYRLGLDLPKTLKSGENRPFSITVPPSFKGPFTVDVRATGRGFSAGHVPGALQGTVGGIAAASPEVGNLTVAITDAAGKKAAAQARVVIEPEEDRFSADPGPAPRPPIPVYTPPVYTPPVHTPPPGPAQPGYAPPSFAGIEQGTTVRQRQPGPAPASGDDAAGRKKWAQIVDRILGKTIHPCYRGAAPQTVEKLRRQMLDLKSVDFPALARMDARQLSRFTSEQEKLFAQKALYDTIMRGSLSGDCPDKMVELLAFQDLISPAQAAAYREKSKPKTVYWVVYTSTWTKRGNDGVTSGRAHVVTGNRPPATGFSQPNPAAAGYYSVVVKAYGTLDQREAQGIANDINQGRSRDVFPRTSHGHGLGHIGKGLQGMPLVSYGRGVEALVKK